MQMLRLPPLPLVWEKKRYLRRGRRKKRERGNRGGSCRSGGLEEAREKEGGRRLAALALRPLTQDGTWTART